MTGKDHFSQFTAWIIQTSGSIYASGIAFTLIVVWLALGPYYHWSDTYQLVINTVTTVVTFLMVFLIQSAQNRDSKAIHIKLDELIIATEKARNTIAQIEQLPNSQLDNITRPRS